MKKNIGLFWLKDDFRLKRNYGLIEATKNYEHVVVFYLYKENKFESQSAQRWWISKSLQAFKNKLSEFNINLEIIKTESYEAFFKKLFNLKNFEIYWNKNYEPNYLKFDDYLIKNFDKKKIRYKYFERNRRDKKR